MYMYIINVCMHVYQNVHVAMYMCMYMWCHAIICLNSGWMPCRGLLLCACGSLYKQLSVCYWLRVERFQLLCTTRRGKTHKLSDDKINNIGTCMEGVYSPIAHTHVVAHMYYLCTVLFQHRLC